MHLWIFVHALYKVGSQNNHANAKTTPPPKSNCARYVPDKHGQHACKPETPCVLIMRTALLADERDLLHYDFVRGSPP